MLSLDTEVWNKLHNYTQEHVRQGQVRQLTHLKAKLKVYYMYIAFILTNTRQGNMCINCADKNMHNEHNLNFECVTRFGLSTSSCVPIAI